MFMFPNINSTLGTTVHSFIIFLKKTNILILIAVLDSTLYLWCSNIFKRVSCQQQILDFGPADKIVYKASAGIILLCSCNSSYTRVSKMIFCSKSMKWTKLADRWTGRMDDNSSSITQYRLLLLLT